MEAHTGNKRTNLAIIVITSVILLITSVIAVVFLASPFGQKIHASEWWLIVWSAFLLGLYIILIVRNWQRWGKARKIMMISMTILTVFALGGTAYTSWPNLPWGQAKAFQTANRFMANLRDANYTVAAAELSPVTQNYIGVEDLDSPEARPVSWNLSKIDNSVVSGTATFSDGVELPVEIRLTWLKNRWRISGVTFGEWTKDVNGEIQINVRMDFLFCCDLPWPIDIFSNLIEKLIAMIVH